MLKVPQFDFTTLDFVTRMANTDGGGGMTDGQTPEMSLWAWSGPSQPLQNLALAVMGLGQILPITAPAPNASWTLDFWGPTLQCNDVVATERDQIWTNIWNSYSSNDTDAYAFLSWAPWPRILIDAWDRISNHTLKNGTRDLPFQFDHGFSSSPWQLSTGGPASLFVAVSPEAQKLQLQTSTTNKRFGYDWPEGSRYCPLPMLRTLTETITLDCDVGHITFMPTIFYENSTLLRCDLLNTSYSIAFTYQNGAQSIRASTNTTGISPIVNASDYFMGPNPYPNMANLSDSSDCSSFQVDPYSDILGTPPPCVFDVDAMRLVSYQGLMTAFSQLVMGDIKNHDDDEVKRNTTIMKTILGETTELLFLRDWYMDSQEDLQSLISHMSGEAYSGLLNLKLPHIRGDLKSTLEQAFQNFTISLLAEPYFQ